MEPDRSELVTEPGLQPMSAKVAGDEDVDRDEAGARHSLKPAETESLVDNSIRLEIALSREPKL